MPKLPKRLPYEAAIAAVILLGSCNEDAARLDRAEANARAAIARQPEIIDRLDRIEERINQIQNKLDI